MSGFVERISVLIDTKVDQATSGIKSFRSSIAEADGVRGKFKAGWQQTTQAVGANIGTMALGAGAALFAFGVKAVAAFEDTAKAALDMGKATGLSTEQASRWIAVGDDFGVTAEQLTTAIGRIAKTLEGDVWETYGIATRNAAGDVLSTNEILVNSLVALSAMTDGTKRAEAGQAMFGKGFSNIAPLIGKTRTEYEQMLSTVEDGQVITASEAKKAEKMRLAQDKLADAMGEVTMAVGEQVASLAPLIEKLADVVALMNQFSPKTDFGEVGAELRSLAGAAELSGDAVAYLVDKGYSVKAAERMMADYRAEIEAGKTPSEDLAGAAEALADADEAAAEAADAATEAREAATKAAEDAEQAIRDLTDAQLASIDSLYAGHAAQDRYTESLEALGKAVDDPETGVNELRQAQDAAAQAALGLALATQANAEALAIAAGAPLTAKASNDELIKSMFFLALGLDENSPVRAALNAHIATLQAIPGDAGTVVHADTEDALDRIGGVQAAVDGLGDTESTASTDAETVTAVTKVEELQGKVDGLAAGVTIPLAMSGVTTTIADINRVETAMQRLIDKANEADRAVARVAG